MTNFAAEKPFCPKQCPVYMKLIWNGNASSKFGNKIKAITSCFFAVKPCVVHNTKVVLPSAIKDSVLVTQRSFGADVKLRR